MVFKKNREVHKILKFEKTKPNDFWHFGLKKLHNQFSKFLPGQTWNQ